MENNLCTLGPALPVKYASQDIQEKDDKGVWRLTVQPQGGHPDTYNAMMQDMAIGKEPALAMREDILQWS